MDLCISVPTYQKAVQTQQLQQDDRKNTASWKCCVTSLWYIPNQTETKFRKDFKFITCIITPEEDGGLLIR